MLTGDMVAPSPPQDESEAEEYQSADKPGGIRTAEQVLVLLAAGAHRIGTSVGVQIMEEFKAGR